MKSVCHCLVTKPYCNHLSAPGWKPLIADQLVIKTHNSLWKSIEIHWNPRFVFGGTRFLLKTNHVWSWNLHFCWCKPEFLLDYPSIFGWSKNMPWQPLLGSRASLVAAGYERSKVEPRQLVVYNIGHIKKKTYYIPHLNIVVSIIHHWYYSML